MKNLLLILAGSFTLTTFAQNNTTPIVTSGKPKLVVGIVVDQMRWDYLYRYAEKYGQSGFKRLQSGYNCENTHIPYIPTYTAPGHTCVYTGSVPAIHGIVGNDWYSREKKGRVYCTEDTGCHAVGTTGEVGQMSPRRMLTTTITDELRLASNFKSKVIGIAIKDRSAILPAGHTANGAYWFDSKSASWITSSYYGDTLPSWASAFNAKKIPNKYLAENWKTILALNQYDESTSDDEPYERPFKKEEHPVFPHNADPSAKDVEMIKSTPWGNTLTFDFAKAAMEGEKLGKGSATDFLALSFSSTDYIGHQFGPNSVEVEDCYIRFDRDLGDFITYLDQHIGKSNYVVFLTADHGAAQANGFNLQHQIPSGSLTDESLIKSVNKAFKALWNIDSMVIAFDNMQFYLKERYGIDQHSDFGAARYIIENGLDKEIMSQLKMAINLHDIKSENIPSAFRENVVNGYNPKRSGDIQLVYEPAVLEDRALGTTHGTFYNYDTHIPLLWYGEGIKPGHDYSATYMTDIAATLAAMLHIQEPNGCVGKPIEGLMKK